MVQGAKSFRIYAWLTLAYTVAVILWGAYVRASGSGAGCGSHWPLCNGTIIPHSGLMKTLIEFTHRVTSGLSVILIGGLTFGAFRLYPRGSAVRRGAVLAAIFIVLEAAIGALLVLASLVEYNASVFRAVVIALHLTNTLLLVASLTFTATMSTSIGPYRLRSSGLQSGLIGFALLGLMVVAASGAIVALGDTLFPAKALSEGMRQDFSPTANVLLRLRVLHPVFAVGIAAYVIGVTMYFRRVTVSAKTVFWSRVVTLAVLAQVLFGIGNLLLLAPIPMQVGHLLLANFAWFTLVMLAIHALGGATEATPNAKVMPATAANG